MNDMFLLGFSERCPLLNRNVWEILCGRWAAFLIPLPVYFPRIVLFRFPSLRRAKGEHVPVLYFLRVYSVYICLSSFFVFCPL